MEVPSPRTLPATAEQPPTQCRCWTFLERAFWLRIEAICAGLPARGSGAVEGRPSAGCRRLPGYLVASVFGVALGLAAYGLYQLLSLHRRTATVQVAVVATLVGSVVFG